MATPSRSRRQRLGLQGNTGWAARWLSLSLLAAPAAAWAQGTAPPQVEPTADGQPQPPAAPAPAPPPPPAAPPVYYPPPGYYPYPQAPIPYTAPYAPPAPPAPPQPAPEPTAAPQVVAAAPPPVPAGRAPAEDPQADRVVLLPTAYTHPQGTIYASSYEIVVLQVGYAFTDRTQLTLTALPVTGEAVTIVDLTLKSALVQGGRVRFALLGSASGAVGRDIGVQLVGRAGGVVQLCGTIACGTSLSLSTNVVLAGAFVAMANGVGVIVRAGRVVSLIGELATLVPVGSQGGQFNGSLVGGGLRFHWPHIGFDLTLLRFLDSATATAPFIAFTYRS